jgi:hypothetical protein
MLKPTLGCGKEEKRSLLYISNRITEHAHPSGVGLSERRHGKRREKESLFKKHITVLCILYYYLLHLFNQSKWRVLVIP